jgi:hypothetical protein
LTEIEQEVQHPTKRFFDAMCIEFGGMGKAAKALGVTYTAIHNWSFRGVPLSRIKQIEELSEGRVHRGLL